MCLICSFIFYFFCNFIIYCIIYIYNILSFCSFLFFGHFYYHIIYIYNIIYLFSSYRGQGSIGWLLFWIFGLQLVPPRLFLSVQTGVVIFSDSRQEMGLEISFTPVWMWQAVGALWTLWLLWTQPLTVELWERSSPAVKLTLCNFLSLAPDGSFQQLLQLQNGAARSHAEVDHRQQQQREGEAAALGTRPNCLYLFCLG